MTWLAAGGEEALDSQAITTADVSNSLDQPTVGERVSALFDLLTE